MYECPFFVYQTQHKLPHLVEDTEYIAASSNNAPSAMMISSMNAFSFSTIKTARMSGDKGGGAAADAYYPVFCNNILASKNMTRPMRPSKGPLHSGFLVLTQLEEGLAAPIQQADYEDNITPQGQSTLEEQPYFVPGGSSEQSGSITHTISHQSSPPQCIGTWPNVLPDSERFLNVGQYTLLFEAFLTDMDSRNATRSIDRHPNIELTI
ncbi:hypothetical protein SNOG_05759 [Parastagonospora nodorum SN15]|uniref:Uncharacterized protein n=1 Tax=Phaeosphaeria nodorum (strain SN15 / ATCC MYA-4574 / FGSC 10173) TaxID=321614 RepID=Q0UR55_PHANO|nr:hypothetical protein SNOG_05759 [Parastagonospora nodorum SN15]EAT86823.1 hypothetical protein SNOG_05759 [Parastagonospora nodorum SN15]